MADIQIGDLTNDTGTGIFDILSKTVEEKILDQYNSGRLKGTDYATVYLGSLQSVLQQSITFLLQEQKAGLEADGIALDLEAKESARIANNAKVEAELEKKWGYDVTRDANQDIVLGASNGIGETDRQNTILTNENLEIVASTTRKDAESTEKVLLVRAQTLGFKSNSKSELLKQVLNHNMVQYTETGNAAIIPDDTTKPFVDSLVTSIKTDLDIPIA